MDEYERLEELDAVVDRQGDHQAHVERPVRGWRRDTVANHPLTALDRVTEGIFWWSKASENLKRRAEEL